MKNLGYQFLSAFLLYVFDDGYVPGSHWSVLMMEFQQELLMTKSLFLKGYPSSFAKSIFSRVLFSFL